MEDFSEDTPCACLRPDLTRGEPQDDELQFQASPTLLGKGALGKVLPPFAFLCRGAPSLHTPTPHRAHIALARAPAADLQGGIQVIVDHAIDRWACGCAFVRSLRGRPDRLRRRARGNPVAVKFFSGLDELSDGGFMSSRSFRVNLESSMVNGVEAPEQDPAADRSGVGERRSSDIRASVNLRRGSEAQPRISTMDGMSFSVKGSGCRPLRDSDDPPESPTPVAPDSPATRRASWTQALFFNRKPLHKRLLKAFYKEVK